jgi:hypothetical protein
MTVKLTLSVDKAVVERAKRYAAKRNASISHLVEQYLDRVSRVTGEEDPPPILDRWRGALKGARPAAWRSHLREKYQ